MPQMATSPIESELAIEHFGRGAGLIADSHGNRDAHWRPDGEYVLAVVSSASQISTEINYPDVVKLGSQVMSHSCPRVGVQPCGWGDVSDDARATRRGHPVVLLLANFPESPPLEVRGQLMNHMGLTS